MSADLRCLAVNDHPACAADIVNDQTDHCLRVLLCERCNRAWLPTLRTDGTHGVCEFDMSFWRRLWTLPSNAT